MNRKLNKVVAQELALNLDDAEHHALCLVAVSPAESALLRRRVSNGELVSPRRGMFARASTWESLNPGERALRVARALAVSHPTWVLSHTSAALVHGMNVPWRVAMPVHYLTSKRGGGTSGPGLVHHRSNKFEWSIEHGVRVTSPVKTVVDCARILPLPDALPIVDSALRAGLVTRQTLEEHLARNSRQRGTAQARRAIGLADPRAESGGESAARGTLLDMGYVIRDLQLVLPDVEEAGRVHRLDIVLERRDGSLVDLEVDGRDKYDKLARSKGSDAVGEMMHERQRESRITAHGLPVVRVSGSDVCNAPLLRRRLAGYGVFPAEDSRRGQPSTGR